MAKKRLCNRHPGSSRCLKKIGGPHCTSQECAKTVNKVLAVKETESPSATDGRIVVGKYCSDCFGEVMLSEKACISCGSKKIVPRYAEQQQGIIIPSVGICTKHPNLEQLSSYCPIPT